MRSLASTAPRIAVACTVFVLAACGASTQFANSTPQAHTASVDFGGTQNGPRSILGSTTGPTTIASFDGSNGGTPTTGLISIGSSLYGAAGLVYSLTPGSNGWTLGTVTNQMGEVAGPLTEANGVLYGVGSGVACPKKCAFSLTLSGQVENIYRLPGGYFKADAPLLYSNGSLYGTVENYGKHCGGCGYVYRLTQQSGKWLFKKIAKVFGLGSGLTAFGSYVVGSTDTEIFTIDQNDKLSQVATFPYAGGPAILIAQGNVIYGACVRCGAKYNVNGTIFSLKPPSGSSKTWTYTTLYTFAPKSAQYGPAGVAEYNGNVYGATYWGGANGYGTLFKLRPHKGGTQWDFSVLWSFTDGADGASPLGNLLPLGKSIYGTTSTGGSGGRGTVFSFMP